MVLLIIAEGTPRSPLPIKQPMSIKHYQQLPGHWTAEAKSWPMVVSADTLTQVLPTTDPPLTSTLVKATEYARRGETRSS